MLRKERSLKDIHLEVEERTELLYALDSLCFVCGRKMEREDAGYTKAADGSEFLSHENSDCGSGMLMELLRRSHFGRRGALRLLRR